MSRSISQIALLVLMLAHAACMIIIVEMTSRVISFIPWGDPSFAGLHLTAIPFVLIPVSVLTVLAMLFLDQRRPGYMILLGLLLVMLFPTRLMLDHQMWIAWMVLSLFSLLLMTNMMFGTIRRLFQTRGQ